MRPLEESFLQLHQSITEDTVTVLVRGLFPNVPAVSLIFPLHSSSMSLSVLPLKETVVKLKSFADHFSSYVQFLKKILPYQLKRSVLCARSNIELERTRLC